MSDLLLHEAAFSAKEKRQSFDSSYFAKFNLSLPSKTPESPNRLHGLNYSTLDDAKTTFDLRTIRNIIIKQLSPKNDDSSIYELFNRLNTGGMNLKPQEIRLASTIQVLRDAAPCEYAATLA